MRNEFLLLFILFLLFRLFRISITLNTLLLLIDDIPRAEEKKNEKFSVHQTLKKKKKTFHFVRSRLYHEGWMMERRKVGRLYSSDKTDSDERARGPLFQRGNKFD